VLGLATVTPEGRSAARASRGREGRGR